MTGMQNIGQGIETSYAQVTADVLGAAALMQVPVDEIALENGLFRHPATSQSRTFAELAYACYVQPGSDVVLAAADAPLLEAVGTYRHPQVNWKPDALGRIQVYPTHANGAAGGLVEVDIETGRVEVLKIWMVADHGVVLNPLILAGQIKGGVVQQLGGTLYECYDYDEQGIPRASTLKEYGMPTVWAAPAIEIAHLTTPSPSTRIGSKGGGEDGCIATSTVLMSAVEDALRPLGVKVMSTPLSPARIKEMIDAVALIPRADGRTSIHST